MNKIETPNPNTKAYEFDVTLYGISLEDDGEAFDARISIRFSYDTESKRTINWLIMSLDPHLITTYDVNQNLEDEMVHDMLHDIFSNEWLKEIPYEVYIDSYEYRDLCLTDFNEDTSVA